MESNSNALRTLVLGLGNPLLGDDGVGWAIAHEVARLVEGHGLPAVEVDFAAGGGLSVMERVEGYDRVILVDAMELGAAPLGSVQCFDLGDLADASAGHLSSPHEMNLRSALDLGRSMGSRLPDRVMVVAVESRFVHEFSEALSPEVAAAVPRAAALVLQLLHGQSVPHR